MESIYEKGKDERMRIFIPTLLPDFYEKPINLDITNRCPLECLSCMRQEIIYDENRHEYKEMSTTDLLKFIKTSLII